MYIEIAKERFSPSSVFVSRLNYAFRFSEFSLFLTPARPLLLLLQLRSAFCCWRGVRAPRDLLWGADTCFLGRFGAQCSRLAGSVPKSLHTPPPCNECPSTWSRVIGGPDLAPAQELAS